MLLNTLALPPARNRLNHGTVMLAQHLILQ
jgi:hypothetical protein